MPGDGCGVGLGACRISTSDWSPGFLIVGQWNGERADFHSVVLHERSGELGDRFIANTHFNLRLGAAIDGAGRADNQPLVLGRELQLFGKSEFPAPSSAIAWS